MTQRDTERELPMAKEAEADVIAACLLKNGGPNAVDACREILRESDFYDQRNAAIWRAIIAIHSRGEAADLVTVPNELLRQNWMQEAGGMSHVLDFGMRDALATTVVTKAKIIHERWIKRTLIDVARETIARCYDPATDGFEVAEEATVASSVVAERRGASDSVMTMGDVLASGMQLVERAREVRASGRLLGVSTGIYEVDQALGGIERQCHYIIAGRTRMGKTALGVRFVRGMASEEPGLFIELEMSGGHVGVRLLSIGSGVSAHKMLTGAIDDAELRALGIAAEEMRDLPVYTSAKPALDVATIDSLVRQYVRRHRIAWVVVDYLGLVKGGNEETREREVAAISAAMLRIAKTHNVGVVSLVQVNRDGGKGTRPSLENLAEADAIGRDAHAVILIHRPTEYGVPNYDDGTPTEGTAELIIAKNRNGPTPVIRVAYTPETMRFESLAFNDNPPARLPIAGQPF